MASNQSSVGLTSLQKWFKVWVALSVGSFLGSSVVPAIFEKIGGASWSQAIEHGGNVVYGQWGPTFLVFTFIAGIVAFILRRNGILQ